MFVQRDVYLTSCSSEIQMAQFAESRTSPERESLPILLFLISTSPDSGARNVVAMSSSKPTKKRWPASCAQY